jgi:hypothetical protein
MSRTGRPRLFPRDPKGGCLTPKCIGDHYRRGYCMTCYFRAPRAQGLSLPTTPRRRLPAEMTPRELELIGLRLFGDDWYPAVAHRLGVTPLTVRGWHRGTTLISYRAARELRSLRRRK